MSEHVSATSAAESGPVFELPDIADESVFVVDDDPIVLDQMLRFLTQAGYNAEGFIDPAEALAEVRSGGIPKVMVTGKLPLIAFDP